MQNKIKPRVVDRYSNPSGAARMSRSNPSRRRCRRYQPLWDGPGEVSVGPRNKHQNDMLMQSLDVVDVLMGRRVEIKVDGKVLVKSSTGPTGQVWLVPPVDRPGNRR